jgi:hypothetical protein
VKEFVLDVGPALLPWAAVLYKLPSLVRAPRDVGRRSLWLTLLFLALAATALVPPVYVGIDHLLVHPNIARLLSNSLTLLTCWTVLNFLAHLSGTSPWGREIRWTALLLSAALLVMAALFLTAPVYPEALDFPERYAAAPHVLEYRLVYLFYVAITDATMTRLCWRYARVASHISLRLGLKVVAAGGVTGLLYVVNDGYYQMASRLSLVYPFSDPVTIHQLLVVILVGLAVIGATMPAWGPQVGIPRLYHWVQCYGALWRLYPLWRDLVRSCPDIALDQPPSRLADIFNLRDVDFRLHRRVVEIRDGILALRPYVNPAVNDVAARLCREADLSRVEMDATIEAASIVAGRWGRANDRPIRENVIHVTTASGEALESEVAELERVARSYGRSSIVRVIRAQLAAGEWSSAEGVPASRVVRNNEDEWSHR